MARRSSRTKHLIGSVTFHSEVTQEQIDAGRQAPLGQKTWSVTSLCGEKYSGTTVFGDRWIGYPNTASPIYESDMPYSYTGFADSVHTCGACQSKALARKLKAEPIGYRLADRMDNSKPQYGVRGYDYKSVYPVIRERDNEIVGFICIDTGWGKSWKVYTWGSNVRMRDYDAGVLPDPEINDGDRDNILKYRRTKYQTREQIAAGEPQVYEDYESTANNIASKEAALMLFPELDKQGKLRLQSEIRASDAEGFERWKTARAERAREQAEEDQRRADARALAQNKREALLTDIRDVLFNSEPPLANFARDVMIRTALAAGYTQAELDEKFSIDPPEQPAPLADDVAQRIADKAGVDTETVQIVHALEPQIKKAAAAAWARHPNNPANKQPQGKPITDEWGEVIGYE